MAMQSQEPVLEPAITETTERERSEILRQLERWLEVPMIVLGLIWLVLLVAELIGGISPLLETVSTVIWIIFIIDFGVKLILAPRRLDYLKRNWLTMLSLMLPALRVLRAFAMLRVLRAASAVRGLTLVRIITAINRGMKALGRSMGRRGLGYVIGISTLVLFAGAAGMFAFEYSEQNGFRNYGEALWWTAMILTTMGSAYWPQSPEGRVLCVLLALYAFTVFGYVTASLASFFIGRDAEAEEGEIAGTQTLRELRDEIAALRSDIRAFAENKDRMTE
jgi:voltage-gated potassium channel